MGDSVELLFVRQHATDVVLAGVPDPLRDIRDLRPRISLHSMRETGYAAYAGFLAVSPIIADMPPCELPSWISRSSSTIVTSR